MYQIEEYKFRMALVEDALQMSSLDKNNMEAYLSMMKSADTFGILLTSLKRMKKKKAGGTELLPNIEPKPEFSEEAVKEIFRPFQPLTSKTKVTAVDLGVGIKKAFNEKN